MGASRFPSYLSGPEYAAFTVQWLGAGGALGPLLYFLEGIGEVVDLHGPLAHQNVAVLKAIHVGALGDEAVALPATDG